MMTEPSFGSFIKLTTPSGGWTWAKIQALECIMYFGVAGNCSLFKLEIFVEASSGTQINPDVSGTIIGAKWIYNLKRSNGSGTSMRYLFGNTGETATSSADIEADLTTGFPLIKEQISEAASQVPTALEDFRIGISAGTDDTGGRSLFCADAWCMLLHVPAAAADAPGQDTFLPQLDEPTPGVEMIGY